MTSFQGRNYRVGAFRSGLEDKISKQLDAKGIKYDYEAYYIKYTIPESDHKYTPDILLPNNIIIEAKGLWESDDRRKHLLIREQYPELDIRFVFSNSNNKLYKGSKTSYAEFCEKHGIMFGDKLIPVAWLREKTKSIPEGYLIPKKVKL